MPIPDLCDYSYAYVVAKGANDPLVAAANENVKAEKEAASSVKWSNLAHSKKIQGNLIFSFPYPLFLHIFDT